MFNLHWFFFKTILKQILEKNYQKKNVDLTAGFKGKAKKTHNLIS